MGFIATILIVLDVSLFYVAMIHDKETRIATTQETLQRAVDDLSDQFDIEFDLFSRTLTGIGEVVSLRSGDYKMDELTLHRLLVRRNAITPNIRSIIVIRPDGSLAAHSITFPVSPLNFADRDYFQAQLETFDQGFFIGKPIASRFDNTEVLPVSVRVTSDGGALLGVAAASIRRDRVAEILANQKLPPKYSLKVFNTNGTPLVCLPQDPVCDQANLEKSDLFRRYLPENRAGLSWHLSFFGEPEGLGAYKASERFPFVVVGQVDGKGAVGDWIESVIEYIVIGIASNLAVILFGIYGARQFRGRQETLENLHDLNQSLESHVQERTAALLRSEQQIQQIFSGSPVAMLNVDQSGRVTRCNMEAMRLFAGSESDILGRVVEDFIPQAFRDRHKQYRERYWQQPHSGMMGSMREFVMLTCDGREIPVEVGLALIDLGEEKSVVLAIANISARKQAELELRHYRDHLEEMVHERTVELAQARDDAESASRAKSAILDNMSHELRTPMHQIIGLAQIIQKRATDERQQSALGNLLDAGNRLMHLIEKVLDLAKLESGRLVLKSEPFAVKQLLETTLENIRPQADKKSLQLRIEPAASLPEVLKGDAFKIGELLNCLLDNAIKFSTSGTITLAGQLVEQSSTITRVRFEVRDQGIGISPENQSLLFKSFTQVDGSNTRSFGGAGLGLSLSKRLVELMGGQVGVESAVGAGSTFWVLLNFPKIDRQI